MDDDVDQADAVAFMLAHCRGDEPLVNELLAMHNGPGLFGSVVGLLMLLLNCAGVDEAAVEATLVAWQERRRASL